MATTKLKRLQMLVDLAQRELEAAQEMLMAVRNQLEANQQQLDALRDYHRGYAEQVSGKGAVDPVKIKTAYAFMDKVSRAITAQQVQVEETQKAVEMAQQQWAEKRARANAMEKLFTKLQRDHQIQLDRQEQKMLDELASIQFSRANPSKP